MQITGESQTGLTLAVAPASNEDEELELALRAEFLDRGDDGYQAVVEVRNVGSAPAGPFSVTARASERSRLGSRWVRTVTHGVSSLLPGRSVSVRSLRLPAPCEVTVQGARELGAGDLASLIYASRPKR